MNRDKNLTNWPILGFDSVRRLSSSVVFGMLLLSPAAFAQWDITPIIKVGGELDDNPNIDPRTDQEINLKGTLAEVSADLTYNSSLTDFSFLPKVLIRNYPDHPEFESNDLFIRSALNHEMTSSRVGFRVNYDEQTVRTAERSDVDFTLEDPDELDANDSGEVALTGDRNKLRLVPSWNWDFSDVSSIGARIDYFDVTYDNVFAGLLTDYTDARLALTYSRAMSARTSFLVDLTGRRFEADDPGVDPVNGASAQIGMNYAVSETTRLRAMVGVENTEQQVGKREPEWIGDLTLTQRLETITMFAQYRRSVNASGAGEVTLRDSVNINFSRSLNEKITAGLGARAYKSKGIGENASVFADREYVQLRSQFIWFLNPYFSVEASYWYTVLDRGPLLDGRANSNRINLWLVYTGNAGNR